MNIGYSRVSSISQGLYGSSLEEQNKQLREAGCDEIVSDVFSGKSMQRPEFDKLLNRLGPEIH